MHLDFPSDYTFSDMQLRLLMISAELSNVLERMFHSERELPNATWHDITIPPLGEVATEILYHYFDVASVSPGPGVSTYRIKYKVDRNWN